MSCKPLIYASTTTSTSVVANGTLPLTNIVRRRGCEINLSGNSVTVADCGSNYYYVVVNATFTAPVAGTVSLAIQQNGTAVAGAVASESITTATTQVGSLTIPAIIRTFNASSIDSLTIVNTGVASTFSNITISVIKL